MAIGKKEALIKYIDIIEDMDDRVARMSKFMAA